MTWRSQGKATPQDRQAMDVFGVQYNRYAYEVRDVMKATMDSRCLLLSINIVFLTFAIISSLHISMHVSHTLPSWQTSGTATTTRASMSACSLSSKMSWFVTVFSSLFVQSYLHVTATRPGACQVLKHAMPPVLPSFHLFMFTANLTAFTQAGSPMRWVSRHIISFIHTCQLK